MEEIKYGVCLLERALLIAQISIHCIETDRYGKQRAQKTHSIAVFLLSALHYISIVDILFLIETICI